MAEETFTCDRCGQEYPIRQMKEAFQGQGAERKKLRLCPNCLDAVMNESGEVRGVAGEEKRAAIDLDAKGPGERESFGTREPG